MISDVDGDDPIVAGYKYTFEVKNYRSDKTLPTLLLEGSAETDI